MPWNSRTSSPSGVTISITLGMTSLCLDEGRSRLALDFTRTAWLASTRPSTLYPSACAPPHYPPAAAAFRARTTRPGTGTPDSIRSSAWAMSAAKPQSAEQRARRRAARAYSARASRSRKSGADSPTPCSSVKIKQPARPQRAGRRGDDLVERAEVHQRVGRHDHVEGLGLTAQVLGQLGLQQLVVDLLLFGLREHAGREVDAGQPPRIWRDERTAQPRSAARVEHVEAGATPRGRHHRASRSTSAGARYASLASFDSKLAAKLSKVCCDVAVRRPRRSVAPGAGRQHVQRDRIAGRLPRATLRRCESPCRFRRACSAPAPAAAAPRGCFGRSVITRQKQATASSRPLQAVEQDAEVGVGVDVLRVEPDGRPVRRLGLDRLAGRPQQHAEIAVGIGVSRIEGDRALVGRDRFVETAPSPAARCRGCCASPPNPARTSGSSE